MSLSAVLNTAASLAVAYLPTTITYTRCMRATITTAMTWGLASAVAWCVIVVVVGVVRWILPLTVVMVGLGCWIMADAVMSPHPPLQHTKTAGAVLAVSE